MLLPDHEIRSVIAAGVVRVHPFDPALIQPASLDIRLARDFLVPALTGGGPVDPQEDQGDAYQHVEKCGQPFLLLPGHFVLGSTVEWVALPGNIAARVEGKSSLGRLGLMLHSTAGWIDPGFAGQITLELSNVAMRPILLWPGQPIGQLAFLRCSSPAQRPYGSEGLGSRYQFQSGPTAPKGRPGLIGEQRLEGRDD